MSIVATQNYVANPQYFISNTGSAIINCTLNDVWTVKMFIASTGATSGANVNTFNIVRIA